MDKLNELQAIKKELIAFSDQTNFGRIKQLLKDEIGKIEVEITQQQKALLKDDAKQPVKINVDIKEHAFDESDKYVKIFIPFDTSKIKEDDVELNLTEDSFSLIIHEALKNHQFFATSLLNKINVAKSYKKVKSDMVSIYLKKTKENETWGCLTKTEKHIKDQKSKMFENKGDDNDSSADPMGGLMNIMKKMYDSGDPEMKRTIAKAWTEGQEKNNSFPMM